MNGEAHKKWWIRADGTPTLLAGSCEPRTHSGAEPTVRAARADIWSIQGDFNYRHHSEHRVSTLRAEGRNILFSESTLMSPGQHIRIWMCYKNRGLTIIGTNRSLSDSWRGFFKVHSIERKNLHKDTCGPEGEWQKITRRPNPDYCQEVWTRVGNAAQNREKTRTGKRETGARQCSKNDRNLLYWSRCQRIFGNSLKNARRKLERPITK